MKYIVTVPEAPEKVKAVASAENTVVISWLPPRHPNGVLAKYNVYIRVLEQGQEIRTVEGSLPAANLHYDATGLKQRETYEAWVTASTQMGQGPSTPVVKFQSSSTSEYTLFTLFTFHDTNTNASRVYSPSGDHLLRKTRGRALEGGRDLPLPQRGHSKSAHQVAIGRRGVAETAAQVGCLLCVLIKM